MDAPRSGFSFFRGDLRPVPKEHTLIFSAIAFGSKVVCTALTLDAFTFVRGPAGGDLPSLAVKNDVLIMGDVCVLLLVEALATRDSPACHLREPREVLLLLRLLLLLLLDVIRSVVLLVNLSADAAMVTIHGECSESVELTITTTH